MVCIAYRENREHKGARRPFPPVRAGGFFLKKKRSLACLLQIFVVPLHPIYNQGGCLERGLRGAYRLGNASNGTNAGSVYLNGNNAPSAANANYGAVLNRSKFIRQSLASWPNISRYDSEVSNRRRTPYLSGRSTDYRPTNPLFIHLTSQTQ